MFIVIFALVAQVHFSIHNYAKAIDSMFLKSESGTAKFMPEDVVNEMETSYIGRQAEKWIEESPVRIVYREDDYGDGNRGDQRRNIINIYPRNIRSNRVAAQTVIHEMGHYHYGIGHCQHAEAICFGLEKLHLTGKEKLTKEEWAYVKRLAIDNYPEYEWEAGGYGDFSKIHIHD